MRKALWISLFLAPLPAFAQATPKAVPSLAVAPVSEPIRADGRLDEPAWAAAPVSGDFIQREPAEYAPATERTEIRALQDGDTLYLGIRAYDSEPEGLVAQEMERDALLYRDDALGIFLDTFLDRRNAFFFETNANGARTDALLTDEGRDFNLDWDGVWTVGVSRDAQGWTAEFAIPFATLRYALDQDSWGLNIRRVIRRKNEETYWSPIGLDADVFRVSLAGQLTGLGQLRKGLHLQVEPYIALAASAQEVEDVAARTRDDFDGGLDLKWGLTRSLALDVTVNTDFAESEVDDQQVNLSRFSLFFPEKREFFLENAGIFEFGPSFASLPLLKVFFSRRIGISADGREVPIEAGARLTGRVGEWSLGLLDVETGGLSRGPEEPSNNWGVVRVKRNLGGRSNVGMIVTQRRGPNGDSNRVYGLDADLKLSDQLSAWGFAAKSDTSGVAAGAEEAGGAGMAWDGSVWDWDASVIELGESFDPQAGFLLRGGVRRYRSGAVYQPRPELAGVRNLLFSVAGELFTRNDQGDQTETIDFSADLFGVRFATEDLVSLIGRHRFERLFAPFEIFPGVVIAPGDYRWNDAGILFQSSEGRRLITATQLTYGDFFDGDAFTLDTSLAWRATKSFRASLAWNRNDIHLSAGDFSTDIYRLRAVYTWSPDLALNSILQYNDAADLLGVNLRVGWIYRPGAELFVVLNQNWDAVTLSSPDHRDRQVILKMTYLWQR